MTNIAYLDTFVVREVAAKTTSASQNYYRHLQPFSVDLLIQQLLYRATLFIVSEVGNYFHLYLFPPKIFHLLLFCFGLVYFSAWH